MMRITRQIPTSTLAIMPERPEARFTPNGDYILTMEATGMPNIYFQIWEDGADRNEEAMRMFIDNWDYRQGKWNGPMILMTGTAEVKRLRNQRTGGWMGVTIFKVDSWKESP